MGAAEIVLIIAGGVILVLSYVLPIRKESTEEKKTQIDEGQIKERVEKEIWDAKKQISDIVDETVTYTMEKTERAMERLTNEKIMAVTEYSDLVLDAINKNHKEVIFLYDMLNDKHENLVSTVSEAAKTAKVIQQTVQDAEISVKEATDLIDGSEELKEIQKAAASDESEFIPISPQKVEIRKNTSQGTEIERADNGNRRVHEESVKPQEEQKVSNNNEKILRLHKLGQSKTAIAKELGLGVGEVKLVIDLFEQA